MGGKGASEGFNPTFTPRAQSTVGQPVDRNYSMWETMMTPQTSLLGDE